jgi:hypothetical protein
MKSVVVCSPDTFTFRTVTTCPCCGRRRRIVGVDHGLWYGVTWTCCGCGDSWSGGERLERPSRRGWRSQAVDDARRRWAKAGTKLEHRHWLDTLIKKETR